jgi:hypothetical protein
MRGGFEGWRDRSDRLFQNLRGAAASEAGYLVRRKSADLIRARRKEPRTGRMDCCIRSRTTKYVKAILPGMRPWTAPRLEGA